MAKVDPGHRALGLSKGTLLTHLESVSPSTGQHLDADDMGGVEPHSDVKPSLPRLFAVYLLAQTRATSGPWKRAAHIHLIPRGHTRELAHFYLLPPQVKDLDLGIIGWVGEPW